MESTTHGAGDINVGEATPCHLFGHNPLPMPRYNPPTRCSHRIGWGQDFHRSVDVGILSTSPSSYCSLARNGYRSSGLFSPINWFWRGLCSTKLILKPISVSSCRMNMLGKIMAICLLSATLLIGGITPYSSEPGIGNKFTQKEVYQPMVPSLVDAKDASPSIPFGSKAPKEEAGGVRNALASLGIAVEQVAVLGVLVLCVGVWLWRKSAMQQQRTSQQDGREYIADNMGNQRGVDRSEGVTILKQQKIAGDLQQENCPLQMDNVLREPGDVANKRVTERSVGGLKGVRMFVVKHEEIEEDLQQDRSQQVDKAQCKREDPQKKIGIETSVDESESVTMLAEHKIGEELQKERSPQKCPLQLNEVLREGGYSKKKPEKKTSVDGLEVVPMLDEDSSKKKLQRKNPKQDGWEDVVNKRASRRIVDESESVPMRNKDQIEEDLQRDRLQQVDNALREPGDVANKKVTERSVGGLKGVRLFVLKHDEIEEDLQQDRSQQVDNVQCKREDPQNKIGIETSVDESESVTMLAEHRSAKKPQKKRRLPCKNLLCKPEDPKNKIGRQTSVNKLASVLEEVSYQQELEKQDTDKAWKEAAPSEILILLDGSDSFKKQGQYVSNLCSVIGEETEDMQQKQRDINRNLDKLKEDLTTLEEKDRILALKLSQFSVSAPKHVE